MIDLSVLGTKHYILYDGKREIETQDPTTEFYLYLASFGDMIKNADSADETRAINLIDDVFKYILGDNYDEKYSKVPFKTKVLAIREYYDFHRTQMEDKFPSSSGSKYF